MAELVGRALVVCGEADGAEGCARALREAGLDAAVALPGEAASRLGPELDLLVVELGSLPEPGPLLAAARDAAGDLAVVLLAAPGDLERGLACAAQCDGELATWPPAAPALVAAAQRALLRGRDRTLAAEWRRELRSAARGRLTGGIAHEIANSLAILTSAVDAGIRELDDVEAGRAGAGTESGALAAWWSREGQQALSELREELSEAGEGARRLKLLARDVRDLVHGDPATAFRVDLAEVLESALRVARSDLAAHARVKLDVPAGLSAKANTGALAEALLHLVRCAARGAAATRAQGQGQGTVALRARLDGAWVVLEVESAEPPRPADLAARRLAALLPPGVGCGPEVLGMALARELLERQGGSLMARPGQGTRILEVRLPAA